MLWNAAEGKKELKSIWAFKRKLNLCGTLNKHNARVCPHGGMKKSGVDLWETHLPSSLWLETRFMPTFFVEVKIESM